MNLIKWHARRQLRCPLERKFEFHATAEGTFKLHVVLLPGFSQFSLSAFIDPLCCANALFGRRLFEWQTVGLQAAPVASSSGMLFDVAASLADCLCEDEATALVLVGGDQIEDALSPQLRAFLRRQVRSNIPIYAVGTATWLLAEAGVLRSGARCTIHWTKLAALSETFQDLIVEDVLFSQEGNIVTCAGGFAAFDLAAEIVKECCGSDLAQRICQQLIAEGWRSGERWQSIPFGLKNTGAGAKMLQVVKLMEKNTEAPLSLDELAQRVSLSRRQLERLFEKHLSTTPHKYYMSVRLRKARQLLENTNMPVIDVAIACGYISSSHFSKSFKDYFQTLPSQTRAPAPVLDNRFAA